MPPPKRKRQLSVVRPVLLEEASADFSALPVDILRLVFERLLIVPANDPALLSAFRFVQVCRRFRLAASRAFGLGDVALLHRHIGDLCVLFGMQMRLNNESKDAFEAREALKRAPPLVCRCDFKSESARAVRARRKCIAQSNKLYSIVGRHVNAEIDRMTNEDTLVRLLKRKFVPTIYFTKV